MSSIVVLALILLLGLIFCKVKLATSGMSFRRHPFQWPVDHFSFRLPTQQNLDPFAPFPPPQPCLLILLISFSSNFSFSFHHSAKATRICLRPSEIEDPKRFVDWQWKLLSPSVTFRRKSSITSFAFSRRHLKHWHPLQHVRRVSRRARCRAHPPGR